MNKDRSEHVVDISDKQDLELRSFLRSICKKFGHKEKCQYAKLYSKTGIELLQDDIAFLKDRDVYYLALEG